MNRTKPKVKTLDRQRALAALVAFVLVVPLAAGAEPASTEQSPGKAAATTNSAPMKKVEVPAPAWALRTVEGHRVQSTDYRGSGILLVLHRGLDCLLCSRQLALLAKSEKEFRDRGIAIVAVAPHWPIASELKKARKSLGMAFPLAVDPEKDVFRDYDCLDGNVALHGSFLIDAAGMLRWSAIGEQPMMEIKTLLEMADECRISATPAP